MSRFTYWWLALVSFLLPIFALPGFDLPIDLPKRFFFYVGVLIALGLYVVACLESGRLSLPRHVVLLAGAVILAVFLLSALFSPPRLISFSGLAVEPGTFLAILFFVLAMALAAAIFHSPRRITVFYTVTLASFFALLLFQILYLIWPVLGQPFNLGSGVDNLLGKWNDAAIFSGLIAVLSLALLSLPSAAKTGLLVLAAVALPLSLTVLILVNFTPVWWALVGISVLLALFLLFRRSYRRVWLSIAMLVFCLLFIGAGDAGPIKSLLTRAGERFKPASVEVRPAPRATLLIMQGVLKSRPVFGVGPNKFNPAWSRFKPGLEINQTPFWDNDFGTGYSWFLTFLVEGGILGGFALILFLVISLWSSLPILRRREAEPYPAALAAAALLAFLYLWSAVFFYVSEVVILAFTFLFSGILIAALINLRQIKPFFLSLSGTMGGVALRLILAVAAVAVIGFSIYGLSAKFFSWRYYVKGLNAWDKQQNLAAAEGLFEQATNLARHDLFYLSLTEVQLLKMKQAGSPEELRALVQKAIDYVQAAVRLNPASFRNWISAGRVYASLAALGISGAAEEAKAALDQAEPLNPYNPEPDLERAKLMLGASDRQKAREYLNAALKKKPDFVPALDLLVQLKNAAAGR